jgi:hypothetical protein
MGNKNHNQQDFGRFLAESNAAGRNGYTDQSARDAMAEQGTWITSQEKFDELYKSVDNFEKFLRS